MNWLLVFAFLFFIGCIIGWCIELIYRRFISKNNPSRKWINPGFLMGPYLPIYGFGLWGMYFVSRICEGFLQYSQVINTIIIIALMTVVMTIIEYLAGIIFVNHMKVKLWDYSREKFNTKGIICPKFSLMWGLLGCFYYFIINPYVLQWIFWLSQHLTFSFFIGMFFGVFSIDVIYSVKLINKMKEFADEKGIILKYEEVKQDMARYREELEERKRFIMAFKSEHSLREHLERHVKEYEDSVVLRRGNKTKDDNILFRHR